MEDNIRIAITPETPLDDEGARITALLDSGRFTAVHLRHPSVTRERLRRIIESVPQRLHGRLRLHGHFDLAADFNLGGLHLNHRCPESPRWYRGPLSRSCHSVDELLALAAGGGYSYLTLSPVMDSVSKPGYRTAFTPADLRRLDALGTPAAVPAIALGGITGATLPQIQPYNFGGYAMLSAAWT